MANRKILFIAGTPLLLLLGIMLSFRILSGLPSADGASEGIRREITQPAPELTPADPVTQKAIESAVRGQLSSIRKGDYATALKFSAPSFRASRDPKQFQEMVETQYKEMTESTREEFERGQVANNAANVRVVVTTTDQMKTGFVYNMVREGDGWYVQACSSGFPLGPRSIGINDAAEETP